MQRAISQRALSSKGAGPSRMASMAASLAGSLSRRFSRAASAVAEPEQAAEDDYDILPLAIAMLVCGTHGDVQVTHTCCACFAWRQALL